MESNQEKKIMSINEALNEYYALKNKYETTNYEKYIKPIILSKQSKKAKKLDYSKLPKFPCINCKRNVGTIFNIKPDTKNFKRTFISKCGDLSNPCDLNINIDVNNVDNINVDIETNIKDMENSKLDLIKIKNDSLFFETNDQTMKRFNELATDLKFNSGTLGILLEEKIIGKDNPIRADLLEKAEIEFGQGFLLPFKDMIKEYLEKNDEQIINNAVNFYLTEMKPKLKEIQELKYKVNYVLYDEEDKNYYLVQMKNAPDSDEIIYNYNGQGEINAFVKGVSNINKEKNIRIKKVKTKPTEEDETKEEENEIKSKKSKPKTLKLKSKLSKENITVIPKKNKTKKQKPTIELIEEPEEEIEEIQTEIEKPLMSSDSSSPIPSEFRISNIVSEKGEEGVNAEDIFGPPSSS